MPLRPFLLPLGVGIDLVNIPRIRKIITKDPNFQSRDHFVRKLLNPSEQRFFHYVYKNKDVLAVSHFLSGRWAAKEAIKKAMRSRQVTWWDIMVVPAKVQLSHASSILGGKTTAPIAIVLDVQPSSWLSAKNTNPTSSADVTEEATHRKSEESVRVSSKESAQNGTGFIWDVELDSLEGQIVQLNISHDGSYACAVALASDMTTSTPVVGEC